MPPMKTMDWPSGAQRGAASWRSTGGLYKLFRAPPDAETVKSSAVHQLSSPAPFAAVTAKARLSGDQSYS